jgi:hypothetical protein
MLLFLALTGGGYALGRAAAPTQADATGAESEAFATARSSALETSFEQSEKRGQANGVEKGRAEGQRAGTVEGKSDGERELAEDAAAASASEPAPSTDPYDYALDTPGPAPQGTSCPPPFQYDMGICVISRPALPEECPPGYEPAGVTGACGPGRP